MTFFSVTSGLVRRTYVLDLETRLAFIVENGSEETFPRRNTRHVCPFLGCPPISGYSVRSAIVGSMLSARRVGTTHPSMQTPSMTIP